MEMIMMKKKYFDLEIDIVVLSTQDVVACSNGDDFNDVTGEDPYDCVS